MIRIYAARVVAFVAHERGRPPAMPQQPGDMRRLCASPAGYPQDGIAARERPFPFPTLVTCAHGYLWPESPGNILWPQSLPATVLRKTIMRAKSPESPRHIERGSSEHASAYFAPLLDSRAHRANPTNPAANPIAARPAKSVVAKACFIPGSMAAARPPVNFFLTLSDRPATASACSEARSYTRASISGRAGTCRTG